MSGQQPAKPWYLKLPAKLAATVFFLVALTTLIGNLFELDAQRRARALQDAPAAAIAAAPAPSSPSSIAGAADAPPVAPAERRLGLQLERIVVLRDGSVGTTDWRFAVEADGEPLFVLQQDALDDAAGRNVALPADARTRLRVAAAGALVTVKAWRGSRLRLPSAEPDASGQGRLALDGTMAPVEVVATDPEDGRFMLHFGTTSAD
ncbi:MULTISPECIES: hypothetical protein [unclassified Luteimonas]|uniref:hypothetical protein n=1 Tax=unclassified Luteimonas TaxID=2629088 RepID=UPI0018F0D3F8|nr:MULTISPECIES: hypothetical protein [unclassified Luteimonas]MBJ6980389.1 hypothetical protein [Luteimonas sp. MC1572]MBJ7574342.1 hypothetical protein [Luteimonas sp. MC1828]QQO04272.1 hypothetical protein JGR64_05910 [Luteimonas sp. MC1572]